MFRTTLCLSLVLLTLPAMAQTTSDAKAKLTSATQTCILAYTNENKFRPTAFTDEPMLKYYIGDGGRLVIARCIKDELRRRS